MKKLKWKSRKWNIVFVSEKKYNQYENVNEIKKRPVLIWNNSHKQNGLIISFYCTSKEPKNSNKIKSFYIKIKPDKKKTRNTWINLSKMIIINNNDINWKKDRLCTIKNPDEKNEIEKKIREMFMSN